MNIEFTNFSANLEENKVKTVDMYLNARIGLISLNAVIPLDNNKDYNLNELTFLEWQQKAQEEFMRQLSEGM
ncbi:hypothetical protein CIRMBP1196_01800 [Enterococcus cecorum]|uniref:hypothetical protein n=1 Tax=Enterococcus cecorum TaxID=44008 RepID=UPI00064306B7|nr:hypothetical protein [Enterococcus cecorum]KLO64308.1 hypothetical protein AA986_11475 [Enterococcus cecorum]CAI3298852.1 hypothetical protein CIRMBP1195_00485 [Enterococcus cecorum]CAI3371529.1 hypothetical protein CIRMBP1319_00634 [Enterococcus cecorum]CAI3457574.1 hypothetical protein CIRMBP1196_01800 [Enterococcus cecorum]CAI3510747.1 hypothetical protein CIRMBP1315_02268 [Enterococcus cecorum]